MGSEPQAGRDAEAVLGLCEGLGGEEIPEGALEQVPLLAATHLEARRPSGGELNQRQIEEREPNPQAGQVRGANHLEEIVVADRELHVEIQETVELLAGGHAVEVALESRPRRTGLGGGRKRRGQQAATLLGEEELIRIEALRVR